MRESRTRETSLAERLTLGIFSCLGSVYEKAGGVRVEGRWRADQSAVKGINLRMAGILRRGEGGWDVDGRAFMVARVLFLGLTSWRNTITSPPTGDHKGPHPAPHLTRPYGYRPNLLPLHHFAVSTS